MENISLPPFWVGQKVVAIKNHSQGVFKKGDEFIVKAVKINHCNCCKFVIHIGIPNAQRGFLYCKRCLATYTKNWNEWWFNPALFAPALQSKFPLMSFSQIQETVLEQLGEN